MKTLSCMVLFMIAALGMSPARDFAVLTSIRTVETDVYLGGPFDPGLAAALGMPANPIALDPEFGEEPVIAVLTDPQYQLLRRALVKNGYETKNVLRRTCELGERIPLAKLAPFTSLTLGAGKPAPLDGELVPVEIVGMLGQVGPAKGMNLRQWDGMTCAISRKSDDGKFKTIFLTLQYVEVRRPPKPPVRAAQLRFEMRRATIPALAEGRTDDSAVPG